MAKKKPEDSERILLLKEQKNLDGSFARTFTKSQGVQYLRNEIERAAGETDSNPSDWQKEAGNYRKGRFRMHGMEIAIENPKDSIRRGKDSTGKRWEVTMPHHYGYIKKTESEADGDHVDCFLGPHPDSHVVFVIDQESPGGRFDEAKVMLGFKNSKAAKQAYLSAFSRGWKGYGGMSTMTIGQFKNWLEHGDTGKRIVGQSTTKYAKGQEPEDVSDFRARMNREMEEKGPTPAPKPLNLKQQPEPKLPDTDLDKELAAGAAKQPPAPPGLGGPPSGRATTPGTPNTGRLPTPGASPASSSQENSQAQETSFQNAGKPQAKMPGVAQPDILAEQQRKGTSPLDPNRTTSQGVGAEPNGTPDPPPNLQQPAKPAFEPPQINPQHAPLIARHAPDVKPGSRQAEFVSQVMDGGNTHPSRIKVAGEFANRITGKIGGEFLPRAAKDIAMDPEEHMAMSKKAFAAGTPAGKRLAEYHVAMARVKTEIGNKYKEEEATGQAEGGQPPAEQPAAAEQQAQPEQAASQPAVAEQPAPTEAASSADTPAGGYDSSDLAGMPSEGTVEAQAGADDEVIPGGATTKQGMRASGVGTPAHNQALGLHQHAFSVQPNPADGRKWDVIGPGGEVLHTSHNKALAEKLAPQFRQEYVGQPHPKAFLVDKQQDDKGNVSYAVHDRHGNEIYKGPSDKMANTIASEYRKDWEEQASSPPEPGKAKPEAEQAQPATENPAVTPPPAPDFKQQMRDYTHLADRLQAHNLPFLRGAQVMGTKDGVQIRHPGGGVAKLRYERPGEIDQVSQERGVPAAAYWDANGTIVVPRDFTDDQVGHEYVHFLQQAGVLNKHDVAAFGGYEPMAHAYQHWLRNGRPQSHGGIIHKIYDFWKALHGDQKAIRRRALRRIDEGMQKPGGWQQKLDNLTTGARALGERMEGGHRRPKDPENLYFAKDGEVEKYSIGESGESQEPNYNDPSYPTVTAWHNDIAFTVPAHKDALSPEHMQALADYEVHRRQHEKLNNQLMPPGSNKSYDDLTFQEQQRLDRSLGRLNELEVEERAHRVAASPMRSDRYILRKGNLYTTRDRAGNLATYSVAATPQMAKRMFAKHAIVKVPNVWMITNKDGSTVVGHGLEYDNDPSSSYNSRHWVARLHANMFDTPERPDLSKHPVRTYGKTRKKTGEWYGKQADAESAGQWNESEVERNEGGQFTELPPVLRKGKSKKRYAAVQSSPRIPPKAIAHGTRHEMEHTDDPKVARKIALDHLRENHRYYEIIEKALKEATPA